MGLSSIKVSHQVEGEYTLAELLDLLGSPKKLKDSLAELEKAAKKADTATKALAKAEALRQVAVTKDGAVRLQQLADAEAAEGKAQQAQDRLSQAKTAKAANLSQLQEELEQLQGALLNREENLSAREKSFNKMMTDLANDRAVFEKTTAESEKEIKKDMKAAEKYRQDALQIRREADDKVEALRKALA